MGISVQELRKNQKQLCDEFVTDADRIKRIMGKHLVKRSNFHNYSIRNQLLADGQLRMKTGEGIDLLAPYKRWGKVNRNVKKGEKALFILAPITYNEVDEETGEETARMYFKRVPVFDLSQTEGEPFDEDYVVNTSNLKYDDVVGLINDIPILESNKILTRGYTDGEKIWISNGISDNQRICVLFHELAHYYLHFNEDDGCEELSGKVNELEAESVSYMISCALGVINEESSTYIKSWCDDGGDLIKGRGDRLINVATKIMDKYNFESLL